MAKWTPTVEKFDLELRQVHVYKCNCRGREQRPPSAECAQLRRDLFVILTNTEESKSYADYSDWNYE